MDFNKLEFEFVLQSNITVENKTDVITGLDFQRIDLEDNATLVAYQTWSGDTLFINNSTASQLV